jgi:hypothetical protein
MPKLNITCSRRLLTVLGAALISALLACAQQTTSRRVNNPSAR